MKLSNISTVILSSLGEICILLGILVLVLGVYTGLGFWIYTLILEANYALAVFVLGISLIVTGWLLRLVGSHSKPTE